MGGRTKTAVCRNCGSEYKHHSSSWGIYCSLSCQIELQTKRRIDDWLSGKVNPMNTNGLLRPWARKYLFILNNDKCSICGWSETNKLTNKIPLEVDHIDGNYTNNEISNLRLLCPNCHSLTATFKNSNKGHGRNFRNKSIGLK